MEGTAYLARSMNRRNRPATTEEAKPVHAYQRVKALLKKMRFRHKDVRVLHIVGSKGKGSTGAIIASTLYRMGLSSLLFTSPHVYRVTERFRIDGKPIPMSSLNIALNWVQAHDANEELHFFEIMTVVACWLAQEACVPFLILEAGIGGRLDATRLGFSEAVIITPIELEHTAMLGDRLSLIAAEKGAVMRPDCPVFCGPQQPEVVEVLRKMALKKQALFHYLPEVSLGFAVNIAYPRSQSLWVQGLHPIIAHMPTAHPDHAQNAALALQVVEHLVPRAPLVVYNAWKRAVREPLLPGRFETVRREPLWIFDGSHTPNSVAGVVRVFLKIMKNQPCVLIFGCAADKDGLTMSESFAPFNKIFFTPPGHAQHTMDKLFAQRCTQLPQLVYCPTPSGALAQVAGLGWPTLIIGSFYLGGEIVSFLQTVGATDWVTNKNN